MAFLITLTKHGEQLLGATFFTHTGCYMKCMFGRSFYFHSLKDLEGQVMETITDGRHLLDKSGPGGGRIQTETRKIKGRRPAFFGSYSSIAKNHTHVPTNQPHLRSGLCRCNVYAPGHSTLTHALLIDFPPCLFGRPCLCILSFLSFADRC